MILHFARPFGVGFFYFPSYRTISSQKVYSPCRKSTFLCNFCKVSALILSRLMAQIFHTAEFFSIQPHPPRKTRSALWNAKLYKDTYKFSATPAIEKKCTPCYTKHDNYRALPERTRSATHPMEIAGGETMAKNAIVGPVSYTHLTLPTKLEV